MSQCPRRGIKSSMHAESKEDSSASGYEIAAIVLAAGKSTRMGTQKMLLPLGTRSVIETVVDEILAAKAAGIRPVIVVVSTYQRSGEAIASRLGNRSVTLSENPDPDGEMLSSLRCGLKGLPENCKAALIALGDQPAIQMAVIQRLAAEFKSNCKGIVVPTHGGKRGHPMLVAAKYFPQLLSQHDGVGLRGLLAEHADDILSVPVDDESIHEDMDFPADYERHLRNLSERSE